MKRASGSHAMRQHLFYSKSAINNKFENNGNKNLTITLRLNKTHVNLATRTLNLPLMGNHRPESKRKWPNDADIFRLIFNPRRSIQINKSINLLKVLKHM